MGSNAEMLLVLLLLEMLTLFDAEFTAQTIPPSFLFSSFRTL